MIDLATHGLIAPASPPRDPGGPRTFVQLLDRQLADGPDAVVLVGRSGKRTAAELESDSNRFAHALTSVGVGPGSRVAASLPNDVPIVVAFIGAMKAGVIWVGINRALAGPEKAYMLADSDACLFLGDPEMVEQIAAHRSELPGLERTVTVAPGQTVDELTALLAPAPSNPVGEDPDPLAPAAIAYTSGTTGRPKGAVHTQHNILLPGKVASLRAATGDLAQGEVLGAPLPLTILNMAVLGPVSAFLRGQRLVAIDRTDAVGLAEWIAREQVETLHAVPTMVHDLLTNPDVADAMLDSVVGIRVGGAAMPGSFRELYADRFGERLGVGYGLTENPTSVTGEDVTEPAVEGSSGRALPQLRVHILDEDGGELRTGEVGEICVGPTSHGPFSDVYRPMLGYWNQPEASSAALRGGLLHTGDLGALDSAGHLHVKDRQHDLIVRGGSNVYPAEVERVLHMDSRVVACAVVGVPDDRLGERVVAFVESDPESKLAAAELFDLCRANLARYKVPDAIEFVAGFERTPMGKIRKTRLREDAN